MKGYCTLDVLDAKINLDAVIETLYPVNVKIKDFSLEMSNVTVEAKSLPINTKKLNMEKVLKDFCRNNKDWILKFLNMKAGKLVKGIK